MKPICVKCQRFYRPKKNGKYFTEGMPVNGARPRPGTIDAELWKPYKIWVGDLWRCDGCSSEIIVGTGREPLSEHYLPDFNAKRIHTGADQLQINDC